MTLSGWQRLGIALSILWAVAAGIHTRSDDVERAGNFVNFAYKVCANSKMVAHDADLSSCEREKVTNTATWMKDSAKNVAFAALAPIPLGWVAGAILVYAWRIQAAGFRSAVPWGQMSLHKKGFVILCVMSLAAGLLFHAMTVMNLYVDAEVPVALSPFMDVTKTGDDIVLVKGTWTRQGRTDKSAMGYPLQTSTIDCKRIERRCTEARASVSANLLISELVEYEVQSWTKGSIVLKIDGLCAEETYTIDLNTKAVSGAGRRVNSDTEYCKLSPAEETEWSYRMEKGFPIYWDLRMKARPSLLRIIQSFFGH